MAGVGLKQMQEDVQNCRLSTTATSKMIEPNEYDHETILDDARLGSPPSKHYLEVVDMFDNVVRECMYVSRGYSGIKSFSFEDAGEAVNDVALPTLSGWRALGHQRRVSAEEPNDGAASG